MYGFPEHLRDWSLKDWLRIVMIVGGYLVLRPHLVKIGERIQRNQLEQQLQKDKDKAAESALEDTPENAEKEKEKEKEEEQASSSGWGWGKSAKKRQEKAKKENDRKQQMEAELGSDDEDVADLLQTQFDNNPDTAVGAKPKVEELD